MGGSREGRERHVGVQPNPCAHGNPLLFKLGQQNTFELMSILQEEREGECISLQQCPWKHNLCLLVKTCVY